MGCPEKSPDRLAGGKLPKETLTELAVSIIVDPLLLVQVSIPQN